jgi:cytochrome oxidase assembly protein ShyY1
MLSADQPGVFQYNWQPINMKPEKHLGYAFQWFALAFVLIIIFIVVNTQRNRGKQ